MEFGNFVIWNDSLGNSVCSYMEGLQIRAGEISKQTLTILNIEPYSEELFNKEIFVVIPTNKKRDIENFCNSQPLIDSKILSRFIVDINQEMGTFLNIINSDMGKDLENFKKDEDVLKKFVLLYDELYKPIGEKNGSKEVASISFKFSHSEGTVAIKNFYLISYIMDCIRKHYDFDIPVAQRFKEDLFNYKKEISFKLYNFFRKEGAVWYCNNKSEIFRNIEQIFLISGYEVKWDRIRKWLEHN